MKTEKKWYAVYTRVHREKKVAGLLERNNIETYCPVNRSIRQWSDRKKAVMRPLFTGYVFVRASGPDHAAIRKTDGVINFVYWLGRPAVIRDEEIGAIKTFLAQYGEVRLERAQINLSDTVRILSGPMADMEGRVVALGNRTVRVLLPSLGFAMVAEVGMGHVAVIA